MRLNPIDGWWQDSPLDLPADALPAGYAWMVRARGLDVMPHHRWSFVGPTRSRRVIEFQDVAWELFPLGYGPQTLVDQVEFALKYDGVNLEILSAWFRSLALDEVEAIEGWVRAAPTSAYARRTWFLYELLSGRTLNVEDARSGPYVPVLDPELYYVTTPTRSKRHRVLVNLLGDQDFSPIVRRTPTLRRFADMDLSGQITTLLEPHDADILSRVVSYLYTKETRSSFEIERETPSTYKVKRFVAVLASLHQWPALTREALVRLQNQIVTDRRNQDHGYRESQVYVARGVEVDFVAPRPEDIDPLMAGWLATTGRLVDDPIDPVIAAAVASFSFVFLHPFDDGNGRIHRFLIHFVLARKGFTPPGLLVPVSATMQARLKEYDQALERFSKPLMVRLRYEKDAMGIVQVLHDSATYYRWPDLTAQAEALYAWVDATIRSEVPRELRFMLTFRDARRKLDAVVELPDRKATHFIARCIEHKGRLSRTRRDRDFAEYTDAELAIMEDAVRDAMVAHELEIAP